MWCKCTKVQCLEVPTGQMSGQTRTPGIDATSTPGPFENGPKRGPGDGGSVPQRGGVDISQETTLFCFLFFFRCRPWFQGEGRHDWTFSRLLGLCSGVKRQGSTMVDWLLLVPTQLGDRRVLGHEIDQNPTSRH